MNILGPVLQREAECEAVLRSLPMWFGIEDALLMYARDSAGFPTFALEEEDAIVGFIRFMSTSRCLGRFTASPSRLLPATRATAPCCSATPNTGSS